MRQRRPVIAVILCAIVLFSMFASSAYAVHEGAHPHECTGENCPICLFVAQLEQVRRGFGMAMLALLLMCFAMAGSRQVYPPEAADAPALFTLVGRKIRLND